LLELNKIYNMDCLNGLKQIEDKSISLAVYDAPYFSTRIKEVGDKIWKNEEDYKNWIVELVIDTQRVLKNNGGFYFFHNDINIMVDLLYRIKNETSFKLKNQITWSKINNWKTANIKDGAGTFRSILQCYGNQRSYNGSATEYIYYFTLQGNDGSNSIYFTDIIKYMYDERNKTGWNYTKCDDYMGIKASYCYWDKQTTHPYRIPSKENYLKLQETGYWQKPYIELYNEYQDAIYKFNQPFKTFKDKSVPEIKEELKPYTTVWEYERDKDSYKVHLTPKPLKMIEHIIQTSSNEGDIVLDCFMGSGTTAIASINTNRQYIGFELDNTYYNLANERINKHILSNSK